MGFDVNKFSLAGNSSCCIIVDGILVGGAVRFAVARFYKLEFLPVCMLQYSVALFEFELISAVELLNFKIIL